MTSTGPASSRWLLGKELRERREAAEVSHQAAADRLGCSVQKIYRVEQGVAALKAAEVDDLLDLYRADEEAAERVRAVGAQARRRGSYGKVPDWSRQYFGLEQDAVKLAIYRGELIPGLLQTESYARSLISTSKTVAPADVEEVVKSRVRRHSLLERSSPPEVHIVLGEAALHRQVGGPESHAEQLRHLVAIARLPHVTLQILSFSVGAHAALGTGFTLLTLNIGDELAKWVYLSDLTRGECRADPVHVNTYQLTFDSLVVNALGEGETLRMLKRSRDGIREGSN